MTNRPIHPPDNRLLGTWVSDKDLTLKEWTPASPELHAIMVRTLGKLSLRYTKARILSVFEGDKTVCRYEVLATDADSVAILRYVGVGATEIEHIHFSESDVYWVSVGRSREFFRRVRR